MKYAYITHRLAQPDNLHSLVAYLRALELSRSGYYDWRARQKTPKKNQQIELEACARSAHEASRRSYGPKRLQAELAYLGHVHSVSSVKRLRKRLGLRCTGKKRWVCTTDSKHDWPIAPNVLEQRFDSATAPNQVWVTDITYIRTEEGWLYMAGVKDLYSKKLVGWSMQAHMRVELVSQALQMAIGQERPAPGLIHHSDRGSQYASSGYRQILQRHKMVASMSRRGNCYDNAPMESFWASLKKEQVHHQRYATREQAKADIFDYVECFYNTTRRHTSLGNVSPAQFVRAFNEQAAAIVKLPASLAPGETQGESLPPAPPSYVKEFKKSEYQNQTAHEVNALHSYC